MLFNSLEFILFLIIVFGLYWFVPFKKLKYQNLFILVISYFFYAWWDWRFLFLMFFSSLLDYLIGQSIEHSNDQSKRKVLLMISVVVNIGLLSFFKYFNFFVDTFIAAFASVGINLGSNTLNIILPVGISFYTFQTLSYSIDIYRKEIQATRDAISYFAFVGFFPQLVAGPIERAKNLLPQFQQKRIFDYAFARDGALQILWGLFKKVAIADVIGQQTELILAGYEGLSASTLVYGIMLIGVQIYADFSSYSDIAIGVGKLFGFRIMKNFDYPLFAMNISDFFRRWHISLYAWFRDYVFFPLGGVRKRGWYLFRNVMIIFALTGLWHGADSAKFIVMGLIYGLMVWATISWQLKTKRRRKEKLGILPSPRQLMLMVWVFILYAIPCIFFISSDFESSLGYFHQIFEAEFWVMPKGLNKLLPVATLFIIDWLGKAKEHPLHIGHWPGILRWSLYYSLLFLILYLNDGGSPYIYFQF